ncbi:CRISPR-associated endonuclease Cas2 [Adlercreutzia sp. ZJ138]|uniref:CRISPR-associated endonuclease Cas2 n=1 Tax=Adlercreutzia sp. ZJ138 TaxID=2709405 RepID=UPI0013ED5D59|nr:CRISPR-associated endonuclease Cas2 [Adlercreutzia sp. ZJ138]
MRIIVMFDLPVATKAERKAYTEFRKFLVKDGYSMEQFSVYSRVTLGRDSTEVHVARLKNHIPTAGSVTVFTMTEKQFENRMVLLGKRKQNHSNDYGAQMTLFF